MIAARKLSEGGCPELLYMESRWDNVCAGQPKDDREKGHGRKRPERKREGGGGEQHRIRSVRITVSCSGEAAWSERRRGSGRSEVPQG